MKTMRYMYLYTNYTPSNCAKIGKYALENGNFKGTTPLFNQNVLTSKKYCKRFLIIYKELMEH